MHFAMPQPLDLLRNLKPSHCHAAASPQHYFTLTGIEALPGVLAQPARHFIEIGERQMLEDALTYIHNSTPDFALNLATITAFNGSLAQIAGTALEDRFWLPLERRMTIRTCLHEAIANAVIHGNLDVGNPSDTPEGFDEYYLHITALVKHEPYCLRRVGIYAWYNRSQIKLSVTDQGFGFTDTSVLTRAPNPTARYGRGLHIIGALADHVVIEKDKRTLTMMFNH